MTQQEAFLQAIIDHPEDPTERLVFADWLEARDDPRAPCLRTEVAAARILGPTNVHGILDIERHLGVQYTAEQCAALAEMSFSAETLRACADTHVLVAGAPLSLLDFRAKHPALFYTKAGGWYAEERQRFSRELVAPRWHLLRQEPVAGSVSKTWDEQCQLLGPDEEVPRAAEVTFAVILHFLNTGQRLFEKQYVRTADLDAGGDRVCVGDFDSSGFHVNGDWVGSRYDRLGLASARKVP